MILYPAIDIRDGKCVRLIQGDYDKESVYGDPVEMAEKWISQGARALHLVDLDGALEGSSKNLDAIQAIAKSTNVPIQVGGGIRTIEKIELLLEIGVSRTILGTAALQDKQFLKEAIDKFGAAIAVSIDAKNGYVATDGWTKTSEKKAIDFAKELEDLGVRTIIYTDIAKDGMLAGPNFDEIYTVNKHVGINVIASGGVSNASDVKKLAELDVYGTIIGKALYTGNIDLEALLKDV
ncbi:phosphoribosylformimino-5-aminoimidazole carboxamide ribotide isomerase [Salirhabdus euzebyi]|uniref:1-(5-phosphoribosyl)-5-[(5-phosphoribosylamino)methylideneamino] imidazole-4-carboxamide isomerase n=1 Tax=Salirhabdus euzebyi TaxID=394506 RepID=A0A841Q6V8_9BACI|nr:1-(5-phosphoribosyl)-5-[(5-phosphoribosylamino)methylideneamino]imidazole-4-carboxamide isomerase [Salirhabdus euzebyi]MBB6454146.1 phosphoribosylformimino-5-aminoimidazole carboxamide ribotide isomerase [Salirhabdus euzebyi]